MQNKFKSPEEEAAANDAMFDRIGEQMRADEEENRRKEEMLELRIMQDVHYQSLEAYIDRLQSKKEPQEGGMAGALQIFSMIGNPDFYKIQAAQRLLRIRRMRYWHEIFRDSVVTARSMGDLLNRIAHLRRQASDAAMRPRVEILG